MLPIRDFVKCPYCHTVSDVDEFEPTVFGKWLCPECRGEFTIVWENETDGQ